MDPVSTAGLIGSTVSGLAGLFGIGRRKTNPYREDMIRQADYLKGMRNQYAGMASSAQSAYESFDPSYRAAVGSYGDYLRRDPYTDSYSTRALNRATVGMNAAYNQAQSNLASNISRRGIVGSSADVGGLAAIESARAGTFAQAQNALATEKANAYGQRLGQLASLYGEARGMERTAAMSGYAAQADASSQIGNMYGNLNNAANSANTQASNDWLGALGSVAGGLGGLLGGRAFRAPRSADPSSASTRANNEAKYAANLAAFQANQDLIAERNQKEILQRRQKEAMAREWERIKDISIPFHPLAFQSSSKGPSFYEGD